MKKLVIVFIFIMFFSQFAFSGDVNVSSFIGAYTGYGHRVVNYVIYQNSIYQDQDQEFNYLMFGINIRFGLSNKISDDLTLYFLGLFDLGFNINFTPEFSFNIPGAILGGEVKVKYKKFFFGLGNGICLPFPMNPFSVFLRPSFGYAIKPNLLIDVFADTEMNKNFRLGFTFSIFK